MDNWTYALILCGVGWMGYVVYFRFKYTGYTISEEKADIAAEHSNKEFMQFVQRRIDRVKTGTGSDDDEYGVVLRNRKRPLEQELD